MSENGEIISHEFYVDFRKTLSYKSILGSSVKLLKSLAFFQYKKKLKNALFYIQATAELNILNIHKTFGDISSKGKESSPRK